MLNKKGAPKRLFVGQAFTAARLSAEALPKVFEGPRFSGPYFAGKIDRLFAAVYQREGKTLPGNKVLAAVVHELEKRPPMTTAFLISECRRIISAMCAACVAASVSAGRSCKLFILF